MGRVVVLLLVDHLLQLVEQRTADEAWVLRECVVEGCCLPQVGVAVDVLLVQLGHHHLLQLGGVDAAVGQGQQHGYQGGGVLAGEAAGPLDRDGGDDGVEVGVDGQSPPSDVLVHARDVLVGEQFQVLLSGDRATLMSTDSTLQLGAMWI